MLNCWFLVKFSICQYMLSAGFFVLECWLCPTSANWHSDNPDVHAVLKDQMWMWSFMINSTLILSGYSHEVLNSGFKELIFWLKSWNSIEKWTFGMAKLEKNCQFFVWQIKNLGKLGSSELEHNATWGLMNCQRGVLGVLTAWHSWIALLAFSWVPQNTKC